MVKWGLGIEKETVIFGYNDNLKDFTEEVRNTGPNAGYNSGEERAHKIRGGNFAVAEGDGTVYNSTGHNDGYEIISTKRRVDKMPKDTFVGFAVDVEDYAKQEVIPRRDHASTLPFGAVPNTPRSKYKSARDKNPGSYHITLTMPYDEHTNHEEYKKSLKKGILNVRLLQPLFLAMTGGTTKDAIGNPSFLEGSLRQVQQGGSGIGQTSLADNAEVMSGIGGASLPGHRGSVYTGNAQNPIFWRQKLRQKYGPNSVGDSQHPDIYPKQYDAHYPSIEWRFMDTFDSRGLYGIFSFLAVAMANSEHTTGFMDPAKEEVWNDAMVAIAEEGWNAYVDIEYAHYIERELHIHLKIENTKRIRADILARKAYEALWEKNKESKWVKPWIPDRRMPPIHNFNKDSWEFAFLLELKNSATLKNKLEKLLLVIDELDTRKSSGKIKVSWRKGKKGYAIRDIIFQDDVMGPDFGREDVEDVLHMLSRYHFITLFYDEGGRIIAIKKNFNGRAEMETLMTTMLNEKKMLNEEEGDLLEVDFNALSRVGDHTIRTRVPAQPRTAPVPRPTVHEVGEPEGEQRLGDYRVNIIRYRTDSDEDLILADWNNIFTLSHFIYQDRQQRVTVKYANTTNIHRAGITNVFWKRTSVNTVIVYISPVFANETNMVRAMETLKGFGMHDQDHTPQQRSIFVTNLTDEQFYNKLIEVAREEYETGKARNTTQSIELTGAGIKRLQDMGIYIGSVANGKKYILTQHGNRSVRILKNIPYYKDYRVEVQDNVISLKRKDTIIDQIKR